MAGLTPFQFSSGKRMFNSVAGLNSSAYGTNLIVDAIKDTLAWQEMWINPTNVKWSNSYKQTQKQTSQAIVTFHFRPDYQVLTCSGRCGWFRIKSELEEIRDLAIRNTIGSISGTAASDQNKKAKEDVKNKKKALELATLNKTNANTTYTEVSKANTSLLADNAIIAPVTKDVSITYTVDSIDVTSVIKDFTYSDPSDETSPVAKAIVDISTQKLVQYAGTNLFTLTDDNKLKIESLSKDLFLNYTAVVAFKQLQIGTASTAAEIKALDTSTVKIISELLYILTNILNQVNTKVSDSYRVKVASELSEKSAKSANDAAIAVYNNTKVGTPTDIYNKATDPKTYIDGGKSFIKTIKDPKAYLKSGHSNRLNNSPSLFLSRLKLTADEQMYYIDSDGVEHYNPKYIKMFTKQYPDGIIYEGYFTTFNITETPDFETVDYDFTFVAEKGTPVTLLQRVLGMYSGYTSVAGDALNIVGV